MQGSQIFQKPQLVLDQRVRLKENTQMVSPLSTLEAWADVGRFRNRFPMCPWEAFPGPLPTRQQPSLGPQEWSPRVCVTLADHKYPDWEGSREKWQVTFHLTSDRAFPAGYH